MKFEPETELSRAMLVTLLYRYALSKGCDVSAAADLSGYSDASAISDWGDANDIIHTEGNVLSANEGATRAETAHSLMTFIQAYEN